jgi:ubiquinone/menaquinone biosynthesis C-methylase UbiE
VNNSEKFWNKLSGKYDTRAEKLGDHIYIETVKKTKRHLNINDIVLDYACGTGIITNEFSDNVKEIHAIDISSGMIDVAKRKAGETYNPI